MNTYTRPPASLEEERTLGDLFSDLSQKASLLVRQEVQLAKVEMKEKATEASKEVALIVVGIFLGNAALLSLAAALIVGLSHFMEGWLAALLVGLVLAVVAGLLVAQGVQSLREMNALPQQTITTLQEDKEWLKRQMS
jgi:uncharacterized membrane protein YqjE